MGSFFDTPFDASSVAPATKFQPIPVGDYNVRVEGAEEKPTKSGGTQLALKVAVADGEYAGRKLFFSINLRNASKSAEEYGRAQVAGLCRSTGVMQPRSWNDFIGKAARCAVKLKYDMDGAPKNDLGAWVFGAEAKTATVPTTAPAPVAGKVVPTADLF